jgi:arginine deiminase
MDSKQPKYEKAAYGGDKWSPRIRTHRDEIGFLWKNCGVNSEWQPLRSVLLHPPGSELTALSDPDEVQMLVVPKLDIAFEQHEAIAHAYRNAGVSVYYVNPSETSSPNLIFCADLFFMTPEGAILARPASSVRAGEERWVARRLADLGVPIVKTLRGNATFEGADALWLDDSTVIIGRGLRTNDAAIIQISCALNEMGVAVITVDLPVGTMHLMGILRFLDKDLALCWPYRLAWKGIEILRSLGYHVLFIPDEEESIQGGALNFVTLGPCQILMADGNPKTQTFLQSQGITCHVVKVDELLKAAGGIGCLTGIIEREIITQS